MQISIEWKPANERPAGQLLPNEYRRVQTRKEGPGEATERVCSYVTTAIITHGDSIGKRLPICTAQDCPVHRPRHVVTQAPDFEQRRQKAQRESEERQHQRDKREKALRSPILRFPSTATEQQMRFLLKALVTGDLENSLERIAERLDDKTVNMASDDVCAEVIDSLMPSSLVGCLAEPPLGAIWTCPNPKNATFCRKRLLSSQLRSPYRPCRNRRRRTRRHL